MKQVHPDTGVISKAVGPMNLFANYLFERFAEEVANKRTISSRDIQTSVDLEKSQAWLLTYR